MMLLQERRSCWTVGWVVATHWLQVLVREGQIRNDVLPGNNTVQQYGQEASNYQLSLRTRKNVCAVCHIADELRQEAVRKLDIASTVEFMRGTNVAGEGHCS